MPTANVFISHHSKDDDHVQKFKDLLAGKDYELRNSSIDSTKPNEAQSEEYIKSILRDGIKWAGTVIVLIGEDTHSREWVNWEIEEAERQGKPVIGVFIHGAKDSDVPEALEKLGDGLVGWNSDNIIAAIEGESKWEKPDGSPRESRWKQPRSEC